MLHPATAFSPSRRASSSNSGLSAPGLNHTSPGDFDATAGSTFSPTGTPPDPTSLGTSRLALAETFFDSRGQRYQDKWWKVESNGSIPGSNNCITTNRWFDPEGNLLMSKGRTIEKYEYNHRCCAVGSYKLASTGDPIFNRAWTLLGTPCVTLPFGSDKGLPLAVQLVGAYEADTELLGWAYWTECRLR